MLTKTGDVMKRRKLNERIENEYEPFCYIIRDEITGIMYIGSRTITTRGYAMEKDLGYSYFTSSKIVKELWSNDNERFSIIKIYSCNSNLDALSLEHFLIDSMGCLLYTSPSPRD